MNDEQVRAKVLALLASMESLRAVLRDLQERRKSMSKPSVRETDVQEIFMSSGSFQDMLVQLQACQDEEQTLLADSHRVSALCPAQYPELLKLNVEIMTAFARVAAQPGTDAPEDIEDHGNGTRQRSMTGDI